MGNYNSEYENYYNSIINGKDKKYSYKTYSSGKKVFSRQKAVRKLIQDFIGVFCLLMFISICKIAVTPQTTEAYNYSKKVVSEDYDYKKVFNEIKNYDYSSISMNKIENSIKNCFSEIQEKCSKL